jgi:hypothetical protein
MTRLMLPAFSKHGGGLRLVIAILSAWRICGALAGRLYAGGSEYRGIRGADMSLNWCLQRRR